MCKNLYNLFMCEGCKLLVYDHCDHTEPGILDLHPESVCLVILPFLSALIVTIFSVIIMHFYNLFIYAAIVAGYDYDPR